MKTFPFQCTCISGMDALIDLKRHRHELTRWCFSFTTKFDVNITLVTLLTWFGGPDKKYGSLFFKSLYPLFPCMKEISGITLVNGEISFYLWYVIWGGGRCDIRNVFLLQYSSYIWGNEITFRWLSTRLQYIHYWCNGDTAVLHLSHQFNLSGFTTRPVVSKLQ